MALNLLSDDRVQWLRQRVTLSLDLPTESFDNYFKDSLERARSAGIARENVAAFLSSKFGIGSAIFFSSKTWEDQVEGILNERTRIEY